MSEIQAPLVSVVIPTFDTQPSVLRRAVDSVLNQDYEAIECVVVDDGSKEPANEVLALCEDPRIIFLRHPRNLGRGAARNTGISASNGQFIAWQDADDWSLPHRIGAQVAYLLRHPTVSILGTGALIDLGGAKWMAARAGDIPPSLLGRVRDPEVLFPTTMMRRGVFDEYRFRPECRVAEDYDFLIRSCRSVWYANIEHPTYVYTLPARFDLRKYRDSQAVKRSVIRAEYGRTHPGRARAAMLATRFKAAVMTGAKVAGVAPLLVERRYVTAKARDLAIAESAQSDLMSGS